MCRGESISQIHNIINKLYNNLKFTLTLIIKGESCEWTYYKKLIEKTLEGELLTN